MRVCGNASNKNVICRSLSALTMGELLHNLNLLVWNPESSRFSVNDYWGAWEQG